MKQNFAVLLIALTAIALVSGCVNQTPAVNPDANGIVIKNVYVDPPADQIESNEVMTVTADIENVGSATARNVVAELVGASWRTTGELSQIRVVNFADYDEEGDGIRGTTLTPPDPQFNLPGQLKTIQFRLPAPPLPEGQKANFDLKIRVSYDYETSALAQIKGYSRERYNTLYQQGKITPPTSTAIPVQVSQNVPITVSMVGPDKFIVGPGDYDEYTYQFTFKNSGTSVPITRSTVTGNEEDGLILGATWLQGPGIFFRNCFGVSSDSLYSNMPTGLNDFFTSMQVNYKDRFSAWYQDTPWGDAWGLAGRIGDVFIGIQQTPAEPTIQWPAYVLFPNALSWDVMGLLMEPLKLRRGDTLTKSCTIGILNNDNYQNTWADRSEDSMIINAHLKYRYFIDQPLTLTVTAPIVRVPLAP